MSSNTQYTMFAQEHHQIDPEMYPQSPNSNYEYTAQLEFSGQMPFGQMQSAVMFDDAFSATVFQEPQQQYPPFDSPQTHGYSTTSGQSSNMNSPQSIQHNQFPGQQLGSPVIAGYDNYTHSIAQGGEYNYQSAGMEDFALFQPAKPTSPFIGEYQYLLKSRSSKCSGRCCFGLSPMPSSHHANNHYRSNSYEPLQSLQPISDSTPLLTVFDPAKL